VLLWAAMTPSLGESATWRSRRLSSPPKAKMGVVLDAYQPHKAGGRGTCERRMTLRNWRLESHDVGQQQSESTKERGRSGRSRSAGYAAVIGRRGAESSHRLNAFFLAVRESCFQDMEPGIRGDVAVV
jgi:hypothetical protein